MVRRSGARVRRLAPILAGLSALALAAALLAPAPASAQEPEPAAAAGGFRPRLVRPGTVTLHGGALYGSLFGGGSFAEVFDHGLGLGFALRYRNSAETSYGLGFEAHRFDSKIVADSAGTPVKLQLVVTTLDYYRHYNTRTRLPRYLVIGAGLMQSRQENLNGEKEFNGDGGVIKLGGGLEYWVNRSLSMDFGVRYYGVLSRDRLNHDVEAGVGFNFYTSP